MAHLGSRMKGKVLRSQLEIHACPRRLKPVVEKHLKKYTAHQMVVVLLLLLVLVLVVVLRYQRQLEVSLGQCRHRKIQVENRRNNVRTF